MKKALKRFLWIGILTSGLAITGTTDLQAQVLTKDTNSGPSLSPTNQPPINKDTSKLERSPSGVLNVRRGSSDRALRSSNGVLRVDRNTVRGPDSRLPEKVRPETPQNVLKKKVL